ncbi:eukaryotic translation initiation factor 4E-binding protein 2 [Cimex lectularius]|uniref:Eukaryotic translation initiation factor 4E binding protein n=1 Tax=Cimex lectularius TaxID=79782 RepID=A0A8I6RNL7_CIMLE|nr:eukaryotic translation initiation factor 4E-binding protein 2 [Cimex lectularius]
MSASPVARQATQSQIIPSKRMLINDPSQLPVDYSTTPGGTLYSTTPGGTRIVYERSTLMYLRNSPLSNTPPKFLDDFPCRKGAVDKIITNGFRKSPSKSPKKEDCLEQFDMDI